MRALPENRRVRSVEVLNPGIQSEAVLQKFIILDIRAKDESNRQYDIENPRLKGGEYASIRIEKIIPFWGI